MVERQNLPHQFRGNWEGQAEFIHGNRQEKCVLQELFHPYGCHESRKDNNDDQDCLLDVFTTLTKYKRRDGDNTQGTDGKQS